MPTSEAPTRRSAHLDTFCRDALPPLELWPEIDCSFLRYTETLNCATELLDNNASAHGERTAILHAGGDWSYAQLLENANRIAHVLVEDLGVVPGNRVLLRAPNSAMLAACWFAVLKAGAVVVCTNPLLRERELAEIIPTAAVNVILTDARFTGGCERATSKREAAKPSIISFNASGPTSLETLMRGKPLDFTNCPTSQEDVAIIAFTSGTTGQSKGTMHFHRDLLAVADTFARFVLQPDASDIFCGSPSLAFTYGLGGLLLFPFRCGASTLLLEQGTPSNLLQAIQQHRATVCFTSPTGYRAMLKHVHEFDLSSLKKCVSAGEHLPAATFESWRRATGLKIIDGIGSTEMLHMFISSSGDDIRPGATGKIVLGYQAKVVDDEGREVAPGTIGRLAVRGPTGCRYLNNPEQQKKYVQEGWNFTNDSFHTDTDCYFWYHARTDDMIVSSGYNISGVEIENVLLAHPKVAECAVVGIPDADRGQIVKAFVVPAPGCSADTALAKELQDFVKAEIAPYKYPRAVEFMDSLPRNANGKLQRYRLREVSPK
jgi:2-aminobenzoate-CoA ligase